MSGFGTGTTMLVGAGLFFIGFVVSWFMAPETKRLTLDEASALEDHRLQEGQPVNG